MDTRDRYFTISTKGHILYDFWFALQYVKLHLKGVCSIRKEFAYSEANVFLAE